MTGAELETKTMGYFSVPISYYSPNENVAIRRKMDTDHPNQDQYYFAMGENSQEGYRERSSQATTRFQLK